VFASPVPEDTRRWEQAVHNVQTHCGGAGIRQTNRLRQRYLGSVLRQEIGFFDTTATTGVLLQVCR
jgi:hypothetical protein